MTYPASTVPRSREIHEGVVSAGGGQVQYGPFVMNNRAEIRRAIDDAAAGRLGAIPARNLRPEEAIQ